WEFSAREIDRLEAATAEIQRLALAAGDAILNQNRLDQMGIPAEAHAAIRAAWNAEPPALYGRLDIAFDGDTIKLLEYNADTPTGLVEAAVAQWYWLQDCFPTSDQFNSSHEKLIAKWKDLKDYATDPIYFADAGSEEGRDDHCLSRRHRAAGRNLDAAFAHARDRLGRGAGSLRRSQQPPD